MSVAVCVCTNCLLRLAVAGHGMTGKDVSSARYGCCYMNAEGHNIVSVFLLFFLSEFLETPWVLLSMSYFSLKTHYLLA